MVNQHSHSFRCDDGEGRTIDMLMSFSENEHLITVSCTFNYHKYSFRAEDSSIIHFKYYKSCLVNNPVNCLVEENIITLHMMDSSDNQQSVKIVLEKQERNHDEKLDIMFGVMMNEIRELKEKLWYADKNLNKFAEKYISNWKVIISYQQNRFRFFEFNQEEIPNNYSSTSNNNPSTEPQQSQAFIFKKQNLSQSFGVNITGLTSTEVSGVGQYKEFKEEGLEPVVIYFKHPVEFSRVEFSIESESIKADDSKVKVFVYGIMKPKGIIRKVGSMTESQNNDKQEFFLMPSLTLLKEQEYLEKQVSTTFDSQQPYDGIGIAVRLNHLSAQNQQIIRTYQHFSYSLSSVRIF